MNPKIALSSNDEKKCISIKPMTPVQLLELSIKQKEQAKKYIEGMRRYFPT
jgi:hypothetical protein